MNDAPVSTTERDQSESSGSGTYRLIIRAPILPDTPAESEPDPLKKARILGLIIAAVAAVLAVVLVISITIERDAPANIEARDVAASRQAVPAPADATATQQASPTKQNESLVAEPARAQEHAAPASEPETMPVIAVTPAAARSALNTIRGTIRVSVRVTIDPQGAVTNATSVDAGPSRYFERISLEAARQWTFTPSNTNTPRTKLLRFRFTREGATAEADEN